MGIQVQGSSGVIQEVGGTGFRGAIITPKPYEYGAFGAYSISSLSGTMAAGLAAGSEIFQFRWTDASRIAIVDEIILDGLSGSATAFTAGFGKVDVVAARSFSAAGTGGTAQTLTTNNGKMRTSMGSTLAGELRCASTAALTAGTKTLDAQAFGQISLTFGTATSVQYVNQVPLQGKQHPLILAQNEGFAVRATVPATGTWQFGITVRWTEYTAF